ncbi:MAG: ABC transporter permease, partial [Ruminococcus sp.]|nr:ABC transporter permease [Ruminococcus sp.]
MTIVKHELRRGKISFFIWTGVIVFMLAVCILLYPEMKSQMNEINDMFSSMGSFTSAFGMDQLNFGSLTGYYAIECGNVLGMGGAFFAALCAVGILSKEEKEKTSEFLLSHPISRTRVITEKLIAVFAQIIALNLVVYVVSAASIAAVGESVLWKELTLLHLAYCILQLEIAGICFGISAFLKKGSIGIGLGIAALLYLLSIIANITDSAEFLKYVTPFGYCEGSQ